MKKIIIILSFTILFVSLTAVIAKKDNGQAGNTGSPGENTCTQCHGGGSSSPFIVVGGTSSTGAPITPTSTVYTPNATYTIEVVVGHPALNMFGFGCEMIFEGSNTDAGTITGITAGGTKVMTAANGRKNAVHIIKAPAPPSVIYKTFMFKWVAPAAGNVVIYLAGVAADDDSSPSGDDCDASTFTLTPQTPFSVNEMSTIKNKVTIAPNPSSNFVTCSFDLAFEANVKVALYDIQGKEVCILLKEQVVAGTQTKTLQYPNTLQNGVYFIKAQTEEGSTLLNKLIVKQ